MGESYEQGWEVNNSVVVRSPRRMNIHTLTEIADTSTILVPTTKRHSFLTPFLATANFLLVASDVAEMTCTTPLVHGRDRRYPTPIQLLPTTTFYLLRVSGGWEYGFISF